LPRARSKGTSRPTTARTRPYRAWDSVAVGRPLRRSAQGAVRKLPKRPPQCVGRIRLSKRATAGAVRILQLRTGDRVCGVLQPWPPGCLFGRRGARALPWSLAGVLGNRCAPRSILDRSGEGLQRGLCANVPRCERPAQDLVADAVQGSSSRAMLREVPCCGSGSSRSARASPWP
jgi:hypothetical protein